MKMSFRDKKLTEGESGSLKRSKKKQKKEDAWRPEGPRDPIAMVCVILNTQVCCMHTTYETYICICQFISVLTAGIKLTHAAVSQSDFNLFSKDYILTCHCLSCPVIAELSSREQAAGDPESSPPLFHGPNSAQNLAECQKTHVPFLGNTACPQTG